MWCRIPVPLHHTRAWAALRLNLFSFSICQKFRRTCSGSSKSSRCFYIYIILACIINVCTCNCAVPEALLLARIWVLIVYLNLLVYDASLAVAVIVITTPVIIACSAKAILKLLERLMRAQPYLGVQDFERICFFFHSLLLLSLYRWTLCGRNRVYLSFGLFS